MEAVRGKPAGTIRFASVLFILSIGTALTTPLILVSYERNGYLPEDPFHFGIQFLAGPFSESLSSGAFIILGDLLTAVAVLDVVAGVMLWMCLRGGVLGFVTSPIVFALGIGFAVPFLLAVTVFGVALVVVGWSSLRRRVDIGINRSR